MALRVFYFLTALASFVELLVAARLWAAARSLDPDGVDEEPRQGFFADAARDCFLTLRALGFREDAILAPAWRALVALVILLPFSALLYRAPAWLQIAATVSITVLVIAQFALVRRLRRRLLPIFFYPLGWALLVAQPSRAAQDHSENPSFGR